MKTCFSVGPLLVLVLFAEPFQTYLLVTIANVVDTLNHIFFLLGECHALFNVWTATNVLQFSSGTVSLNFVWLLQNSLSLTINLIVSFSFIHYRYFVWTATPLFLFSEWNCPTLLCVNEKFTRATNFHISHVKIYLQFLVFFFRLQRII